VQNLLEINYDFPHPFRSELQGRPRIYFVVPDEQGELVYGDLGRLTLAQPTDSRGFARARYEFPLYSHLNTGANKLDDDLVDALLGLANVFMISSDPKTKIEIREDAMPENLKLDALEDLIVEENIELAERVVLARMIKFGEMDKKEDDARANMSRYRPSVPRMRTRSPRRFS
jgi:hypothetical protein